MILEMAQLTIKSGETTAFEAAMAEAKLIISAMPGFIDLQVKPCIEIPNQYLLLVRWQTLADHTEGFRKSADYQRWKALLHHFYEPFPEVFHYGEATIST